GPSMAAPGEPAPTFFGVYGEWMQTPPPTWDDIAWLREQWGGPFMVKGVMRPDDARRAVDIGATAISVSNHGGNNLDGTPASIRALPGVADAVGGQIEVLLDGGIRRGSDVVKALALGARAVMIGRAAAAPASARPAAAAAGAPRSRPAARAATMSWRLRCLAVGPRRASRRRPGRRPAATRPIRPGGARPRR